MDTNIEVQEKHWLQTLNPDIPFNVHSLYVYVGQWQKPKKRRPAHQKFHRFSPWWRSSPLDALSGVSIVFSRKKHEDTRTDFYNFLRVRMLNEVNKWKKVEQMWEWVAHKNSWRLETRKDWLSKFNKKKRMRSRSPPAVPPAKSPNTVTIPLTHLLINGTRAAVRVYPRALAARTVKKRLLKAHVIIWIPRCLGGKELSMGTNHGINESWM